MRVRVTDKGYIFSRLWTPGEEITLTDDAQFAASWMEKIGKSAPVSDPLDHDGDGKKGGAVNTETGLAGLTVVQLRDLAKERGVNLSGVTAKADIIAAIEAVPAGPTDADRIAMARELTGRDDITTAKEADAILAMTDPNTAPDPAPFSDDTPIEAVED